MPASTPVNGRLGTFLFSLLPRSPEVEAVTEVEVAAPVLFLTLLKTLK
ncbi:hypothetical protein [Methanosarcina sp. 2.H.T.1A.15]|nr:hypothetical protein [Methanosarcina sp. 2.H.T.1A.15]